MSTKMNVSANYGSHMACLIQAMSKTSGDVLELGMGIFSTPYLHYQCIVSNRQLVSVDNDKEWAQWFIDSGYKHPNHKIIAVDNYDDAKIEKAWDVVLVDHSPIERRVVDIRRLADLAQYIIIHDSDPSEAGDKQHHYSTIYPLFKYKAVWDEDFYKAAVLSNFNNLDNFWSTD